MSHHNTPGITTTTIVIAITGNTLFFIKHSQSIPL